MASSNQPNQRVVIGSYEVSTMEDILLHLMLILGIKLRRQNMSDLNVATMDYRVIPSIVVINYMDTHLGISLDPRLNQAMKVELYTLEENRTWSLTTLPSSKRAMGCKWVYKLKFQVDGSLEWYKAHIVAKGYTQQESVGYIDTISPVAKLRSGESFLAFLVYVDDIDITSNDYKTVEELKIFLDSQFKLKNLRQLKYFLSLEVARLRKLILFSTSERSTLKLIVTLSKKRYKQIVSRQCMCPRSTRLSISSLRLYSQHSSTISSIGWEFIISILHLEGEY
uniref:Reverse transcriptase Ty1/copia-type domain-containing protein n=1 Tax=Vitis vinifera TaxID=29760 RepID=A5BX35_VITVI|nr:hypothetical protein VITISV_036694 [Vitis vinifera]